MKYFYLILLILFTITHISAADRDSPIDEGLSAALTSFKRVIRSSTPSDAGSYAGSQGGASTIIAQHKMYELELSADTDVAVEYGRLMAAYKELLTLSSKTDTRLSQFVGVVEKILPTGIDRASADEDSLVSLRTAFRQLMDMYKALGKSYSSSTGKTTILESTVSELQAIISTMVPRPTEHMSTDFSPERVKAMRETEVDSSAVVADLRAQLAESNSEKDRLAAENAALKAEAEVKSATNRKKNETEPLLGNKSGKNQGCPSSCAVM